jgi:hypothetical protein
MPKVSVSTACWGDGPETHWPTELFIFARRS